MLDEAQRMPRHPLRFRQFHGLGKLGQQLALTIAPFHVLLIGRFLTLSELLSAKLA